MNNRESSRSPSQNSFLVDFLQDISLLFMTENVFLFSQELLKCAK